MSSPDEFYRLDYGEYVSSLFEKKLDICVCGHGWDEHDNDYPYACWHGHSKEATDPCQCENWQGHCPRCGSDDPAVRRATLNPESIDIHCIHSWHKPRKD